MKTQRVTFEALQKMLDLDERISSIEINHSRGIVDIQYGIERTHEGMTAPFDRMTLTSTDVRSGIRNK